MKATVEMASNGEIYMPAFMKTELIILATLKLFST
jgi:hypothetical protein